MNRFTKTKKDKTLLKGIFLPVFIFLATLLIFVYGLNSVTKNTKKEQFEATKKAVTRAVVHCYAIEGSYPPNIKYLEDSYGLCINHDKYIVDYNCFASNLMPEITVLRVNN